MFTSEHQTIRFISKTIKVVFFLCTILSVMLLYDLWKKEGEEKKKVSNETSFTLYKCKITGYLEKSCFYEVITYGKLQKGIMMTNRPKVINDIWYCIRIQGVYVPYKKED